MENCRKKSQDLQSQTKNIIFNVYNYLKGVFPDETKSAVKNRAAAATGVSLRTVERIISEGAQYSVNDQVEFTSPQKRHRKCTVTDLPEWEENDIRTFIYDFHKTEKCRVTVTNLQQKLANEYEWCGKRSSVYKIVKKLGFTWKNSINNRQLLMERNDIRSLRLNYLDKMNYYRNQGRSIVFLDESYIHAGHTTSKSWSDGSGRGLMTNISKGNRLIIVHAGGYMGFISNCLLIFKSGSKSGDYHDDMNSKNYEKWLTEKLIPNLPTSSVVVTDNAPYHNVQLERAPSSNSKKQEMVDWLTSKNIDFSPAYRKPQLYEIIRRHKKVILYINLTIF